MKIAQIVASLEPRNGGPSISVPSLAGGLAALGHEVQLLTTGPAATAAPKQPNLSLEIFPRGWPDAFCPSAPLRDRIAQTPVDLIHSHGLWLRPLHYAHRTARRRRVPHVISPRGMMSGWAWRHHAWRKRLVRTFVHPGALEGTTGWHATSAEEADDIRSLGFKQPVCVAPNGTTAPSRNAIAASIAYWRETCPEVTRRPTAVFYSRFHRKKRVLELIDLWLAHAPADWLLLMVGLADDYTAAQLETYVMRASGAGRILVYEGDNRPPPYAVGSLFVLPSWSENFGLAIAEAMSHGLPALVTDTTPWSALNTNNGGWCVPWENFAPTLVAALAEGTEALAARGAQAREFVLAEYSWENSARILSDFYQGLSVKPAKK